MVTQKYKSTYYISVSELVGSNQKKLIDKLKEIKARKTIANKKGSQANAGKSQKINISWNKNHTKHSASHNTGIGKSCGWKIAKNHERKDYKWCKQKGASFWLHNADECIWYNVDLTPVHPRDSKNKKNCFHSTWKYKVYIGKG